MIHELIDANIRFLEQGTALLDGLPAETYARTEAGLSSVGGHLRHVLDHYHSLIAGVRSGRVDYDHRAREVDVERDPAVASARIAATIAGLQTLRNREGDVEVKMDPGGPPTEWWSRSSIARELQFLISHTVHHYALMKAVLARAGISPGADFGVAPSTLAYRSDTACAR